MKHHTSTSPPAGSFDPTHCPICGGDNRCAMEIERDTGLRQPPCWCVSATFSPELLARMPAEAQGQACVCAHCLSRFSGQPPARAEDGI